MEEQVRIMTGCGCQTHLQRSLRQQLCQNTPLHYPAPTIPRSQSLKNRRRSTKPPSSHCSTWNPTPAVNFEKKNTNFFRTNSHSLLLVCTSMWWRCFLFVCFFLTGRPVCFLLFAENWLFWKREKQAQFRRIQHWDHPWMCQFFGFFFKFTNIDEICNAFGGFLIAITIPDFATLVWNH